MTYTAWNATDGIPVEPRTFRSIRAAADACQALLARVAPQGYWKTFDCRRIGIDEVELQVLDKSLRVVFTVGHRAGLPALSPSQEPAHE